MERGRVAATEAERLGSLPEAVRLNSEALALLLAALKASSPGSERHEVLRAETEQLKNQNTELKMKTQVELEALHEQLRVRKEKQYQLLEKLQGQEEAKRQAEDQVSGMEDKLRQLHAKNVELDTQLLGRWAKAAIASGLIRGYFEVDDRLILGLSEEQARVIERAGRGAPGDLN